MGIQSSGRSCLKRRTRIYTQWSDPHDSNAVYIGPIFKQQETRSKCQDPNFVFVTLGTREEPFTRLVQAVEKLVKKGIITDKVIIQAGHTKCRSDHADVFDFCGPEKIDELILNARYVITQESAGIGTQCLKYKTKFFVMPRDYHYGELPTKSDMKEDLHYRLEELGYTKVVQNADELEEAILDIHRLAVGFDFNNSKAISTLQGVMEGI